MSHRTSWNTPWGTRKSEEKGRAPTQIRSSIWHRCDFKIIKIPSPQNTNKSIVTNIEMIPKHFQNGSKNDAPIIQNKYSPNYQKNKEVLSKRHEKQESEISWFWRRTLYCCSDSRVARFGNVKEIRKSMRKPSSNQGRTNAKSMLNPCSEKWCQFE